MTYLFSTFFAESQSSYLTSNATSSNTATPEQTSWLTHKYTFSFLPHVGAVLSNLFAFWVNLMTSSGQRHVSKYIQLLWGLTYKKTLTILHALSSFELFYWLHTEDLTRTITVEVMSKVLNTSMNEDMEWSSSLWHNIQLYMESLFFLGDILLPLLILNDWECISKLLKFCI